MKQNDRSVQKTIFFPSNVYEFQWKLVHFYKVWRSCPASMDFFVKGSCCCVPSVGWNKCTAAWLQWLTSALFLIIAVLQSWPHYPRPLLCMSPVSPWSLHVFSYLGFHLQLLFWLLLHLSLVACLQGPPSRHFWFTRVLRAASCNRLSCYWVLTCLELTFQLGQGMEGVAK